MMNTAGKPLRHHHWATNLPAKYVGRVGGLAVALAEMAMSSGVGATIIESATDLPLHAWLFGEDQGRYLATCREADTAAILSDLAAAGVSCGRIGVTGGDVLSLPGESSISIAELRRTHEGWLPSYMAGAVDHSEGTH